MGREAMLATRHEGYGIPPYAATQATIHPFMATFSSEELARQVLAMFTQDHAGKAGRLLNRQDLLAQWPKGFTHVELTTALEYAMSKGWLEQTEQGMKITPAGLVETKFNQLTTIENLRKGTAMDFVTLLRRDHEKVSSLFHRIQSGFTQPDTPERHQLFRQLKQELDLHAAIEDLHVYRVFQQAESTRDEAHDALEAHRNIKTLLDELEAAPAYDHRWVAKFQELHKLVEAHVAEEENVMFRQTQAIMTAQEADELGAAVETAKKAISRNAPTTEGGTPEEIKR